ncbi:protein ASPARTIC PROTEASE IN GUARD CELL 1-like [Silene latifolia]|uniref:protein ASPARTIC PROTEASE IN GUARD CELL 1-like n=1 Tax=Silene latifolia TaxID=37657 RepID=UPI003D77E5BA
MDLYIGDPVQLVYGIFDTGSDLVWVQCKNQAEKGKLAYYNQSASNSFYSIPKQIYPDDPKFSYCISGLTSGVNFVRFGTDAKLLGRTVNLFRHRIDQSYFMDVIGVQVNEVDIKVDPLVFALSRDGKTGFTIDSGYDITSLSKVAFDALKDSLYEILGTATKCSDFEICYPHSTFGMFWPYKFRPKIGIKFPGWVLEVDVWRKMGNTGLECLQVQRTPMPDIKLSVLGAQQLFDVNVGHDLKNNLLYLQPMKCPTANY